MRVAKTARQLHVSQIRTTKATRGEEWGAGVAAVYLPRDLECSKPILLLCSYSEMSALEGATQTFNTIGTCP
eukprot:COSAG03_NODE_1895_length_3382_cov_7.437709_2_plen_72_part_00